MCNKHTGNVFVLLAQTECVNENCENVTFCEYILIFDYIKNDGFQLLAGRNAMTE